MNDQVDTGQDPLSIKFASVPDLLRAIKFIKFTRFLKLVRVLKLKKLLAKVNYFSNNIIIILL